VSYTELEFGAATEAGLPRLVFMLDEGAADVGLPVSALIDRQFGTRQGRVPPTGPRQRAGYGVVCQPGRAGQLVERSLRELAKAQGASGGSQDDPVPAVAVAGRSRKSC
jgi:hypothetical protein